LSIVILLIAVISIWNLIAYWKSDAWVQVQGAIIQVKAVNRDGTEANSNWSGRGRLSCEYEYAINGQTYSGNRIGVERFGASLSASRYRSLKTKLAADEPVTVLVNPKNPAESALFRDVLSEFYFGPGLALFWFGALFVSRGRNQKKTERL
jgi:hypothetical protein